METVRRWMSTLVSFSHSPLPFRVQPSSCFLDCFFCPVISTQKQCGAGWAARGRAHSGRWLHGQRPGLRRRQDHQGLQEQVHTLCIYSSSALQACVRLGLGLGLGLVLGLDFAMDVLVSV
jgi:hypothetical protein